MAAIRHPPLPRYENTLSIMATYGLPLSESEDSIQLLVAHQVARPGGGHNRQWFLDILQKLW